MNWLKNKLIAWLLADHDARLKDIERHFVTKRDREGAPIETLAVVPIDKRKELKPPRQAGMSWHQRRAFLEATDGETRAPIPERIASTS
jgi:hypothetical protein